MSTPFTRTVAKVLSGCALSLALLQASQAAPLISTEAVAQAQAPAATPTDARAQLQAALQRADVAQALTDRGVSPDAAAARVAALTDTEAALLLQQIDAAPAGGDLLGTLVFLFVVLLVTDILGLTRVFPFTRPVR